MTKSAYTLTPGEPLTSAREGLIHGMVRYGERDVCGVFATTATMGGEDCIAPGDDCGRVYAVLRMVVELGWDGRDFDISFEPEDAEQISHELTGLRVGQRSAEILPTTIEPAAHRVEVVLNTRTGVNGRR